MSIKRAVGVISAVGSGVGVGLGGAGVEVGPAVGVKVGVKVGVRVGDGVGDGISVGVAGSRVIGVGVSGVEDAAGVGVVAEHPAINRAGNNSNANARRRTDTVV